jgi:hypothetical protein
MVTYRKSTTTAASSSKTGCVTAWYPRRQYQGLRDRLADHSGRGRHILPSDELTVSLVGATIAGLLSTLSRKSRPPTTNSTHATPAGATLRHTGSVSSHSRPRRTASRSSEIAARATETGDSRYLPSPRGSGPPAAWSMDFLTCACVHLDKTSTALCPPSSIILSLYFHNNSYIEEL